MSSSVRLIQTGLCSPCEKYSYRTRQDAKNALRRLHPGAQGLGAYRCREGTGMWHFGHCHRKTRGWSP